MVTQWWWQLPINRNEPGWQSSGSTKETHGGAQLSLIGDPFRLERLHPASSPVGGATGRQSLVRPGDASISAVRGLRSSAAELLLEQAAIPHAAKAETLASRLPSGCGF